MEIAGLRVGIEVPSGLSWEWPDSHVAFGCPSEEIDLNVGVRVATIAELAFPLDEPFVYEVGAEVLEIGRRCTDWVLRVSRRGVVEREAVFDSTMSKGEVVISPALARRGGYPLAGALEQVLITHRLSRVGGLVLQGTAVGRSRKALVFLGTQPEQVAALGNRPSPELQPIASESLVLRAAVRGVRAFALPWDSRGRDDRRSAPVEAVHVMFAAPRACSERIGGENAVDRIAQHLVAPLHDPYGADRTLRHAAQICERIPVLRLGLPSERAVTPVEWGRAQPAGSTSALYVS